MTLGIILVKHQKTQLLRQWLLGKVLKFRLKLTSQMLLKRLLRIGKQGLQRIWRRKGGRRRRKRKVHQVSPFWGPVIFCHAHAIFSTPTSSNRFFLHFSQQRPQKGLSHPPPTRRTLRKSQTNRIFNLPQNHPTNCCRPPNMSAINQVHPINDIRFKSLQNAERQNSYWCYLFRAVESYAWDVT